MLVRSTRTLRMLALAVLALVGLAPASRAQERDHVVPTAELRQKTGEAVDQRATNETAVRHLLDSGAGREALKSAGVDYQKVDKAIGQLNDDELQSVAERSRQAERDFAAGNFSDRDLIVVILVILAIILIIIAVR